MEVYFSIAGVIILRILESEDVVQSYVDASRRIEYILDTLKEADKLINSDAQVPSSLLASIKALYNSKAFGVIEDQVQELTK